MTSAIPPSQVRATATVSTPVQQVAASSGFMSMMERIDASVAELEQIRARESGGVPAGTVTPEHCTAATPQFTLSGRTAARGQVADSRRKTAGKAFAMPDSIQLIAKDNSALDGQCYITPLTLEKDPSTGKITASNIYQFGNMEGFIAPEVKIEGNTVTIAMQKILYNANYGDISIAKMGMQGQQITYSYDPIVGSIDEQGNITLPSWGIMVTDGPKKYAVFNVFTGSDWLRCNATYTTVTTDGKTLTGPMLVEQTGLDELAFYNMAGGGYGEVLYGAMTAQKKALISPQKVFTNAMVGDFFCYPAYLSDDGKVMIQTAGEITAEYAQGGFSIGRWVVANRRSPSQYVARNYLSTTVATGFEPVWPEAHTVQFDGAGTQASPYLIKSANDLALLSEAVNQNMEGYATAWYKMTADVDFGGLTYSFRPIGNASCPFAGHFDGDNHRINAFTFNGRGYPYSALFGRTAQGAEIRNVTITKAKVEGSGENIAGLVGLNYADIENISVSGDIKCAGSYGGGIAAQHVGSMKNVSFIGTVLTTGCGGGLAAVSNGAIAGGSVAIDLSTEIPVGIRMYVGGAVGLMQTVTSAGRDAVLTDTYVSGTVQDTKGYYQTGGLAGYIGGETSRMERCFNTATVQGTRRANDEGDPATGGVVGLSRGGKVTDCYNAGTVIKQGQSETAGGITGYLSCGFTTTSLGTYLSFKTIYTNCYNTGQVISVSANGDRGLVGSVSEFSTHPELDPVAECIVNCAFDKQATGLKSRMWGKPSSTFLSGTLPAGYSSDVWEARQGFYPTLKGIGDNAVERMSAAAMLFSNGESANKVKLPLSLSAGQDVQWAVYDQEAGTFGTESPGLKMDGNTLTVKNQYSNEIVVCMTGNAFRMYRLAVVPKAFEGQGTEADPYLIKTKDDLIKLDRAVGYYQQSHEGDFFRMTNDIDLNYTTEFAGVGARYNHLIGFAGTFDGGGYSIRKLRIQGAAFDAAGTAVTEGSYTCTGLFNCILPEGTVKNLSLASDCQIQHFGLGGGVAGINQGRIENCRNYAPQTSIAQYSGGIAGQNYPTGVISHCYNGASIVNGVSQAGGIVGLTVGVVEKCQNDGVVEGKKINEYSGTGKQTTIGGIAGVITSGAVMRGCVNNGSVSAFSNVGGLTGSATVGTMDPNTVEGCVSTGTVQCKDEVNTRGAIAGASVNTTYTNCYYDGAVILYDAAASVSVPGVTALSSSELTGGTRPAALPADDWVFVSGYYPAVKGFENEAAGKAVRSMYLQVGKGVTLANLQSDVALSPNTAIQWSLAAKAGGADAPKSYFTLADGKLKVTVPQGMEVGRDTLTAKIGDEYVKTFVVQTVPVIFEGQGTSADPYKIRSVQDMNNLADFVFNTGFDYSNTYFRLLNDLDWQGGELNPVAKGGAVQFNGYFDGGGHTLKNYQLENTVIIDSPKGYQGRYLGIFGKVGSLGRISNLNTEGGDIYGDSFSGGIVGELYGTVENCTFRGTLRAKSKYNCYLGGICCRVYAGGVVRNCVFDGRLEGVQILGGIAAKSFEGSRIEGCVSKGHIEGTVNNGGVVVIGQGEIIDCTYQGTRSATSNFTGIVHELGANGLVQGCCNKADLIAADPAKNSDYAGIVGTAPGTGTAVIRDCRNEGNIRAQSACAGIVRNIKDGGVIVEDCTNSGNITTEAKGSYTGGIFGQTSTTKADYTITIRRCVNTGDIDGGYMYVGGVGGRLYSNYSNVDMEYCYNYGKVNAKLYGSTQTGIGGVVGGSYGDIYRCYNLGDVTTVGHGTGGVAGITGRGSIRECFNAGALSSTGQKGTSGTVGGLIGYTVTTIALYDSYNLAPLTAPKKIGGLVAALNVSSASPDVPFENCYNAGKMVTTGDAEDPVNGNLYVRNTYAKVQAKNLCYDNTVNPVVYKYDPTGCGYSTEALMSKNLGDKYVTNRACYPLLSCFADDQPAALQVIGLLFTKTDDAANNINDIFYIGHPNDGLVYELTGGLRMSQSDPGKVYPVALGPAAITVKTADGKYSRTFAVVVNTVTGVSENGIDAPAVVSRTYYDLQGMEITNPAAGSMVIVRTVYSDGIATTVKAVVR